MLTSEQLNTFKSTLLRQKKEIEERLTNNDYFNLTSGHAHDSVGELSSYDNHPGDEGTELFERQKDIALKEHEENELNDITRALKAIENGTYGKCEVCGKNIDMERLEALPTTTYCIDHTPDKVVSKERPIEEEVLLPPFGKFDMDDKDETVVYDAEDTWQEVQRYGTSETPSDFMNDMDHYNDVYTEQEENVGYVEDFENFVGVDMHGKNVTVYPNNEHEQYEDLLDEEGIMTTFGDLKPYEIDPYVEDDGRDND